MKELSLDHLLHWEKQEWKPQGSLTHPSSIFPHRTDGVSVKGQRDPLTVEGARTKGSLDGVRGGREERATSRKELDAESGENSCVFPSKEASLEVLEEDLCPWPQVRGLCMSMPDSPALCVRELVWRADSP